MLGQKPGRLAIALTLIGAALACFMSASPREFDDEDMLASLKTTVVTQGGEKAILFTDARVFASIGALTRATESVVVGTVSKSESSRNTARDPADPSKEASDRITMSQEYFFEVEEWVKGAGAAQIRIVYPQYTIIKGGARFEQPYIPLRPGTRYVLFLREGIPGTYSPVAEPWQFLLAKGRSTPVTALDGGAPRAMVNLSQADLLSQVRKAPR